MYILTIEVNDKTYKQFKRSRPINFSVWNARRVQTYNRDNETVLLFDQKPDQCYDLVNESSSALIYVEFPISDRCPTVLQQ